MRRTLLLILTLLLPMVASADAVEKNGIWYNLISKGKIAEVTKNPNGKYAGSIEIPESVIYNDVEYRVTSIESGVFYECKNLISIAIPKSVTNIGDRSFAYCSSLVSIVIPNRVTSIGRNAFSDCIGLTAITIPNTIYSIEDYTFYGCSGLTSVTIPNNVTFIGNWAFMNCTALASITIGSSVRNIGSSAFANSTELTNVFCYAEKIPQTTNDSFRGSYIEYATLHVPASALEQYKATAPWSDFGSKVPIDGDEPNPEPKKCATPTVCYVNGELSFRSETEDAEFVSEITDADIKRHYSQSVSLTATYHICVYAAKEGFENSDTVQATLCWIDQQPATEGIVAEDAITEVKALPVLIQTQSGIITVQGAAEGTEIMACGINGVQQGSAIAGKGIATINTSLQPGAVAIVRIGEKTIKVTMR